MCILWKNDLNHLVTPYAQFSSRCCAVRLSLEKFTCAIICVYLPNDNYSNVVSDEMRDTLDSLEAFICALNVDCILLGGDYNVDFLRTNADTTEFIIFFK